MSNTISCYLTAQGKTQSVADWSRETGIGYNTLKTRIRSGKIGDEVLQADPIRAGLSKRDAIVTINGETKWLSDWARENEIETRTIYRRHEKGVCGTALLKKNKYTSNANHKTKDTLCCWCGKFCGGCSWSKDFIPVEGWTATPTITSGNGCRPVESYLITACPDFVADRPFTDKN